MPRPPARHDRTGVHVELQRGVKRRRWLRRRPNVVAATNGLDDPVDLIERQGGCRQHGGPIPAADGFA